MKLSSLRKSLTPMLRLVGLPSDFLVVAQSTKVLDVKVDLDEDGLSAYVTVKVSDLAGLHNLRYLVEKLSERFKELSD